MEPTSPPPRTRSQDAVLLALSDAAVDGRARCTLAGVAALAGLGETATRAALRALEESGALTVVERSTGRRPNVYVVNPSDEPLATPRQPLASTPRNPSPEPLANPSPSPAGEPGRGTPPPTPSPGECGSPDPEGSSRTPPREPLAGEPLASEGLRDEPIGRLAVRAAMDAAKAAGVSIPADVRPRIGHAAQQLAKDESVETILAAARRLGEGGFADLYTAVRAVERNAPPPAPPPLVVPEGARLAPVLALLRGTWPRAVIDLDVWERELERIPVEFLLDGVRELARAGGDFAPHWGQVYRTSRRIGVEVTERRRSAAERKRLRAQVDAIEAAAK